MIETKVKFQIEQAINGDRTAVESLVISVQDNVFGLCLKMLWNQEDAKEACQEILIKMLTHLSQFNFASKFETWVYKIALNHLLDFKRSAQKHGGLSFTSFETDLMNEQIEPTEEERNSPEFEMQLSEIRLSCTTALLQCLDSELRSAYVLGEILECDHQEAAEILEISTSAFRKRLERARKDVELFTVKVCGVLNERASCQCVRRLSYAKSCGRVDFKNYPFSNGCRANKDALEFIKKIDAAKRAAVHYQFTSNTKSPVDFRKLLKGVQLI